MTEEKEILLTNSEGVMDKFYCKECKKLLPLDQLVKGPPGCNGCGRRAICHHHSYLKQKKAKEKRLAVSQDKRLAINKDKPQIQNSV